MGRRRRQAAHRPPPPPALASLILLRERHATRMRLSLRSARERQVAEGRFDLVSIRLPDVLKECFEFVQICRHFRLVYDLDDRVLTSGHAVFREQCDRAAARYVLLVIPIEIALEEWSRRDDYREHESAA